jgi:tRNA 2-thiouridine synthesizing protein A
MPHVSDRVLDVKGLKCPQPLLKCRKAIMDMTVGEVLQVIATDRGSLADFEGWAKIAKDIELLAQETAQEGGDTLYVHYVRRTK